MPHPADVQSNLELQFNRIDKMYTNHDLRVFGRDTDRIFKEVDVIRHKQIELATEHIGLDSMDDMSLPIIQTSDDINDEYKRNLVYFNKKEKALKSLMSKLDTLGQIMNDFREASDLNPHTIIDRRVSEELISTAPTSPTPSRSKDSQLIQVGSKPKSS